MKKVYCLYRVSDRGQVEKNDIPMQKIACQTFARCHGWEIVKEFTEKGVSGYKRHMDDRDTILEIKNDALFGKFDVLLVFMFDRIGRRDDETPFVVEWLVQKGIAVWSVCEGEQRFDNHVDKLTNYIRYWQAAGESERISERTRTRIRQLTSEGHFTGGVCPYGYQLVRQGRENKRKQPLYDLAVHPDEAKVVQFIFAKAGLEGYGVYRIAKLLNEQGHYPKSGKHWSPVSLYGLLRNPLYTGVLRKGDATSYQKDLQIISQELFDEAQKFHSASGSARMASRIEGALLSGLLICGHCGARMASNHINRQYTKKDGTVVKYRTQRYYCPRHRNGQPSACTGQCTYVAEKVDRIFIEQLSQKLRVLEMYSAEELAAKKRKELIQDIDTRLCAAKQRYREVTDELQVLEREVPTCLNGKSAFTTEQLSRLIARLEGTKSDLEEQIQTISAEKDGLEKTLRELKVKIEKHQVLWNEYFSATQTRKKIILSLLVKRVKMFEKYRMEITINKLTDHLEKEYM